MDPFFTKHPILRGLFSFYLIPQGSNQESNSVGCSARSWRTFLPKRILSFSFPELNKMANVRDQFSVRVMLAEFGHHHFARVTAFSAIGGGYTRY